MKVKRFKWYIVISVMIIFFEIWFLSNGYGHKKRIDEVNFEPPVPKPESTLKLYISLFPSEQEEKKISIRLIAWRDLNNDFMYTELGEEEVAKKIEVTDNEKGDEEPLKNEIRVIIDDDLQNDQFQKYTAIVTVDKDKKSSSIIVKRQKSLSKVPRPGNGDEPDYWPFRKIYLLFRMPYEVALRLTESKEWLRRCGEDGNEIGDKHGDYEGRSNVYIYNLSDGKLESILQGKDSLHLSPVWSFDNKRIALIVNKAGKWRIAWTDIRVRKLQMVTEGPDDLNL